ncbi:MAG: DUF5678 domain-containing protein [Chloroflexota bacterium]
MATFKISEELAGTIQKEAMLRGMSVEDYLQSAVRRERTISARVKIESEQEWWLGLPLSQRAKYEGEFVAIHNRKLVDHDKDEQALYARTRKKFGKTPVLIMPAEGPREIRIYSPRLVRQSNLKALGSVVSVER